MRKNRPLLLAVLILISLVGSILLAACNPESSSSQSENTPEPTIAQTKGEMPESTPTKTITNTPELSLTSKTASTPEATVTPDLGIGSSWTRPLDSMVMMYVPAGEFLMGSEDGDGDEQPIHNVYLDDFWIDQTEVTDSMYMKCVKAGACQYIELEKISPFEILPDYPASTNWEMANNFCGWVGARLPTEAEWEKAARGGLEGKKYPWGDESPTCQAGANNGAYLAKCSDRTITKIKTFALNGYGLYDMAGNAFEWVADWYDNDYYENSPVDNPKGPDYGSHHVFRSNSWPPNELKIRVANRYPGDPTALSIGFGFRCAKDATL